VISQITTSNARPIPQSSPKQKTQEAIPLPAIAASKIAVHSASQQSAASLPQPLENIAQEKNPATDFHGFPRINQTGKEKTNRMPLIYPVLPRVPRVKDFDFDLDP
jgi:hypothetical protein